LSLQQQRIRNWAFASFALDREQFVSKHAVSALRPQKALHQIQLDHLVTADLQFLR